MHSRFCPAAAVIDVTNSCMCPSIALGIMLSSPTNYCWRPTSAMLTNCCSHHHRPNSHHRIHQTLHHHRRILHHHPNRHHRLPRPPCPTTTSKTKHSATESRE